MQITTSDVLANVSAINAQSSGNPDRARRAMLLLEEAQTNGEIFVLLAGILGWDAGVSLEEMQRWNAGAQAAPALGFVFDPRPVAAEAAAVSQTAPEWVQPLSNGQKPDVEREVKTLNRFLESAGIARLQDELERQYSMWRSAQK